MLRSRIVGAYRLFAPTPTGVNVDNDAPLTRFAALEWPKPWNSMSHNTPCAAFQHLIGGKAMLTTCIGFVQFDLAEDGPHILRQLETACDLLRDELT